MLVQCSQCGAPLDVSAESRFVKCLYCRNSNRVASSKTLAAQTPADFRPPETWTPPAEAPAPSSIVLDAKPRGRRVTVMVMGAGILLALATGLVIFGPTNLTNALNEWYQAPCAVDANGDDVLDLVGLMGRPGREHYELVVVDGLSGSTLWTGPALPLPSPITCPTPERFVVERPDFTAGLYRAADTALVGQLPLSDKVAGWGSDGECVTIHDRAGQRHGFLLADGRATDCPAAAAPVYRSRPNMAGDDENVVVAGAEGSHYTLTAQSPGTPFLTAAATGPGGEELWSNRLQFAAAGHDTLAMVMADGVLVIYAGAATDDDYGVLIGLDPATGGERYALPQSSSWSGNLQAMLYNGKYVLVHWGMGLHAHDPETGDLAWNIGGR